MPKSKPIAPKSRPRSEPVNLAASTLAVDSLDFSCQVANKSASKYSAPALEKGLDILEALADAPQGYTLNELAKVLGRSMGEIFRMAVTLEARGWVFLAQGDRYVLSLHMFELANRHRPMNALITAALPLMQRYAQEAQQSCHLTLPENGRLLIVAHVDAPGMWSFSMRTGAVASFYNSASGLVLLAARNAEQRQQMLRSHGEGTHDGSDIPPVGFDALLDQVRQQGFARVPSRRLKGITDIAYPILGRHGLPIGALVSAFLERIDGAPVPDIQQALASLRRSARLLSQALGYAGPSTWGALEEGQTDDTTHGKEG